MAHVVKPWCCLALLTLAASNAAHALGPAQPFTPPAAVRGDAADPALPPPATARLGGLRLGAAPAALIDGQWVGLGARIHGARLQHIEPPYAVLQHPDGRLERLALAARPDGVPTPTQVNKTFLP